MGNKQEKLVEKKVEEIDEELMESIKRAEEDAQKGHLLTWNELLRELGLDETDLEEENDYDWAYRDCISALNKL